MSTDHILILNMTSPHTVVTREICWPENNINVRIHQTTETAMNKTAHSS